MIRTVRFTDSELRSAVAAELQWLPSIDSEHIEISVDGGAVTLSGTVPTYPQTLLATKAALSVRGVTAIAQELAVRGPSAGNVDSDIAREAGAALQRAVNVPDTVKASVTDHCITLSGEVMWQYERDAACRAVNYLPGVRRVDNTMTIRPGVLADGIHDEIAAALIRNAEIDGQHINVSTDTRGVITLEGTVGNLTERRRSEQICWSAPGVTNVVNNLTIH